jgi:N utilization substance protein A
MQESVPTPLDTVPGLTAALLQKLNEAGIDTVEKLAALAPEDLENIPGIGSKTVEKITGALSDYYAELPSYQDEMERNAAEMMFSKDTPAREESDSPENKETTDAPAQ